MRSVFAAVLAEFFQFQPGFQSLLIFSGKIVDLLALGALQLDHVVLAHRIIFIL